MKEPKIIDVTAVNKIEDYYKDHKFIAIPVCGFKSKVDGEFVYDLDTMSDELDNAFLSLGVDVICSITKYEEE